MSLKQVTIIKILKNYTRNIILRTLSSQSPLYRSVIRLSNGHSYCRLWSCAVVDDNGFIWSITLDIWRIHDGGLAISLVLSLFILNTLNNSLQV